MHNHAEMSHLTNHGWFYDDSPKDPKFLLHAGYKKWSQGQITKPVMYPL